MLKLILFEMISPSYCYNYSERRDNMEKTDEMDKKVCEMRQNLQRLISEKTNLLDPEVISASQKLDVVLNEYHMILSKIIE
jgi:type IV pilus biogenesis protein CpaD/CtpE